MFSGRRTEDGAFVKAGDWELALVPRGFHMPDEYFEAIAVAARAAGDHTAVIKAMDTERDINLGDLDVPYFEIDWEYEALDVVNATFLWMLACWMWGRSARWGYVSEVDFGCLGGTPDFMAAVAERLGGREVMRRRFLVYEENEWFAPEDRIDRVMRAAGWKREIDG